MTDRRPLMAKTNPIFADDPLAAVALAETMGEMERALNWDAPDVGAALRLARQLLGVWQQKRADGLRPWAGGMLLNRRFRLGPCLVSLDLYRQARDDTLSLTIYLYTLADRHVRREERYLQRQIGAGGRWDGDVRIFCPAGTFSVGGKERNALSLTITAKPWSPHWAELQALLAELRQEQEARGTEEGER